MTASAKKLTKSAKHSEARENNSVTNPVNTARVFLEALCRVGYDRQALLAAVGLDLSKLEDPDARIPCQALGEMFGYAIRTRPVKNLGMKLAVETPIGAFPLLDYLIVSCGTVADAIHQLSRYYRLNDAPYTLEVRDQDNPCRIIFHGTADSLAVEFGVSLVILHLREETENRLSAAFVCFSHKPDDISEMERVLGCPVSGEQTCNAFGLSQEAWHLPMRRRDPVLRRVLEEHAEEIIGRMPKGDRATMEIRRVIMSHLSRGETEIQNVARALTTSTRSLQRRLSVAGTSYQELLDSTRRQVATHYLQDDSLSIGEVGYLLGYSEPSAFHRAFKRWIGITPHEFRQQKAEARALSNPLTAR